MSVNQGLGEISFCEYIFMNSLGDGKHKVLIKSADNRKGGVLDVLKSPKWSWKLKLHEKNQDGIQEGRTLSSEFGQEESASQMFDGEQLVGWIRTEEDSGIIKHCWLSINQPRHPGLDRPNTKLGLINTRKTCSSFCSPQKITPAVLL